MPPDATYRINEVTKRNLMLRKTEGVVIAKLKKGVFSDKQGTFNAREGNEKRKWV